MKSISPVGGSVLAALAMTASLSAHAALMNEGNGLIYDSVQNITWISDVDLAKTQMNAMGATNFINQVKSSVSGDGSSLFGVAYTLTASDFNTTTGQMSWFAATAWAAQLTYGGSSDWRLPAITGGAYGGPFAVGELGAMFINTLSGTDFSNATNAAAKAEFTDYVNSGWYWTSANGPWQNSKWIWNSSSNAANVYNPSQYSYAWLVADGNVAATGSSVPEPSSLALLGLGAIGFLKQRRKARQA
jgi:hypothetical protein